MTERRDEDTARRERLLAEATQELQSVRQQGTQTEPLLNRLTQHARENRFAERFLHALDLSRRRPA